MISIRRRLLIGLLAGVTLAVVLSALSTYRVAREEASALFDYQMQQAALSLGDGVLADALVTPEGLEDDTLQMVVQISDAAGTRLYVSRPTAAMPQHLRPGFADVSTESGIWRVYTARTPDHLVQVAQPQSIRDGLAADLALRTIWPLAAVLPLLGILIWITVGRGLAPLARLAGDVGRRSPLDLQPVPERGMPDELRPLTGSLNGLLQRLSQALEAQRAFVADAAHELRTPLTALSLQAQNAQRAGSEEERAEALARLRSGIERATHLVEQLLVLARAESRDGTPAAHQRVALESVAQEALGQAAPVAAAKRVDLGAEKIEPLVVNGEAPALRALFSNLIDNAVKYTPAGGRVDVAVFAEGDKAVFEARDTGPGIPADELERVFDRFYRVPGSAQTGSGLGLAIAKRIVDAHGGTISLRAAEPHGLCARVELPRALDA